MIEAMHRHSRKTGGLHHPLFKREVVHGKSRQLAQKRNGQATILIRQCCRLQFVDGFRHLLVIAIQDPDTDT